MTENSFTPITEGSDVSAYENTDLSALNPESEEVNPSTEKLRNILEKTILIARYVTWFGLACMLVLAFYGWTRNQMQNSWLMGLKMNTNDSIWCQWMSHGHNDTLRKDAAFRSFLISR